MRKRFRNGDTPRNEDTCELGKHAWCQNVLKNRPNLIEQGMKKKVAKQKQNSRQYGGKGLVDW